MAGRRRPLTGGAGKGAVTAIPYAWLLLFFLAPFAIVFRISLSEPLIAQPPYSPLFGADGSYQGSFFNYDLVLTDEIYRLAFLGSLEVAASSTLFCLLIGFPMAYGIARADAKWRLVLLLLVVLPFWTSFLLRVYAWIGLLNDTGLINTVLQDIGLIADPIRMMQTQFSVQVGIVYTYLPFMILPLYATLERLDWSLVEAAQDLGCSATKAFWKITVPLSLPGIVAGSMLVFIPAMGEFVIPALLGGPDTLMAGRILWDEFFSNRDWTLASTIAIVLLALLVVPIVIFQAAQQRENR
ncbi:MAG: ABC transporter permease subunit [Alphaproteobacteria bacterium]|nr:ABC transporter permease subunit [Alphaproteobacteria bacterium]